MKSNELASLADVTVRTLRHYHQIGILPEPGRDTNGYRQYTVHDLIRLLRIKRLAALGISLDKMTDVLDAEDENHHDLLTDLERELDAQIARLVQQKTMLGIIRRHETSPDVPPELARFIKTFALAGNSRSMNRIDREQAVLLAHLVGETGMEQLTGLYERISAPDTTEALSALTRRFDQFDADTSSADIDRFVADFVQQAATIIQELSRQPDSTDLIDQGVPGLLEQYLHDALNPAQQAAITRIAQRLEIPLDLVGAGESTGQTPSTSGSRGTQISRRK